jgi:hypothetical protein
MFSLSLCVAMARSGLLIGGTVWTSGAALCIYRHDATTGFNGRIVLSMAASSSSTATRNWIPEANGSRIPMRCTRRRKRTGRPDADTRLPHLCALRPKRITARCALTAWISSIVKPGLLRARLFFTARLSIVVFHASSAHLRAGSSLARARAGLRGLWTQQPARKRAAVRKPRTLRDGLWGASRALIVRGRNDKIFPPPDRCRDEAAECRPLRTGSRWPADCSVVSVV